MFRERGIYGKGLFNEKITCFSEGNKITTSYSCEILSQFRLTLVRPATEMESTKNIHKHRKKSIEQRKCDQ